MRKLEAKHNETRESLSEVVGGLGTKAGQTDVPACPGWTVHNVLSHVTGLCSDVVEGRIDGAGTSAWTQAQVDARSHITSAEVIDEWAVTGPKLAAVLDELPGRYGDQIVADLTVHTCDVRSAVGLPLDVSDEELARCLELVLAAIVHPGAEALGIGPIRLVCPVGSWSVGASASASSSADEAIATALLERRPLPEVDTEPRATLSAPALELFRGLTGRRSIEQIRRMDWSSDPSPHLGIFGLGPFETRETDLME
jgi:uncharacterized protein (TIGR03083 family)